MTKKLTKHGMWLGVAFLTGLTFVGYFYTIRDLVYDTLTLQRVLIEMSVDPEGRTLLGELNLDGFSRQDNALFDGIGELINALSMG